MKKSYNLSEKIKTLLIIVLFLLFLKGFINLNNIKILAQATTADCSCKGANGAIIKGTPLSNYTNSILDPSIRNQYANTVETLQQNPPGKIYCINNTPGEVLGIIVPLEVNNNAPNRTSGLSELAYPTGSISIPQLGFCRKGSTIVGYKGNPLPSSNLGFLCCPAGDVYSGYVDNTNSAYCCPRGVAPSGESSNFKDCKPPDTIYSLGDSKGVVNSSKGIVDDQSILFTSDKVCSKVGNDFNIPTPGGNSTIPTPGGNSTTPTQPGAKDPQTITDYSVAKSSSQILSNSNGYKCGENFGICGSSINILQSLDSGSNLVVHGNVFSNNDLASQIRSTYGSKSVPKNLVNDQYNLPNDSVNLCLNGNLLSRDIIPFYTGGGVLIGTTDSTELLMEAGFSANGVNVVARACPVGYKASEDKIAKSGQQTNNYDSWGCCPISPNAEYRFVTQGDQLFGNQGHNITTAASVADSGICCKIKNGESPGYIDGNLTKCTKDWWGNDKGPDSSPNWIELSKDHPIHGEYLGYTLKANGTRDIGSKLTIAKNTAVPAGCKGDSKGCALISDGNTYKVVSNKDINTIGSGISCNKDTLCFANGDDIIGDNTVGKVITCQDGNAVAGKDYINNSPEQTVACSKSDPANNAFCKSCLLSGGLWLANGCVDPTPLGIITGIIRIALGIMGGVSLILLILAGIALQSGDEKRIEDAKKELIAVFTGILVLVFSVLILRIIGVNILDILPKGSI